VNFTACEQDLKPSKIVKYYFPDNIVTSVAKLQSCRILEKWQQ